MQDAGGRGPCMVEGATRDSPAEAAGLRNGDLVLTIDKKPIANCTVLLDEITSRAPGDTIEIKLQRLSVPVTVTVQLTTRDALLRRVIGRPIVPTNFVDVDTDATYDLSAMRGRMAIVGLYNPACTDCPQLFSKFRSWARSKARKGPPPLVLAVVAGDPARDVGALQKQLDVPLAVGEFVTSGHELDASPFSRELVIFDRDRLGVIVVDGDGMVQYIGPIAPNSDDTEAVLDELFAAADQAIRRSR